MFSRITEQFRRLRRKADWRAITDGSMPWLDHDAVILGQTGGSGSTRPRIQSYEVYLRGRLVATRPSLSAAKAVIEAQEGRPLEWQRATTDPVQVEHYYFGETEEFGSPTTYWHASL